MRPGREHDTTALRTHTEILPALTDAAHDLRTLGDLGYEGESDTITVAFKKPKGGRLTLIQQQLNKAHNGIRAIGERGNSPLKMTLCDTKYRVVERRLSTAAENWIWIWPTFVDRDWSL